MNTPYKLHLVVFFAGSLLLTLMPLKGKAQSAYAGQFFPFRDGIVNDGTTMVGTAHKGLFASAPSVLSYDAQSGFADTVMPALSYHFRPSLSADMSLPYYPYLRAVQTGKEGIMALSGHENAIGDLAFASHYRRTPEWGSYTLTAATCAPIGDKSLGLSAGRMTANVDSHVERQIHKFATDADAGFGDSSNLVRESARKNYTSLGKLGFVQAGSQVNLPRGLSLSAHGYDQIPIGRQTVFTSVFRQNANSTVLHTISDAQDYGVSSNLDMVITPKLGFSTSYSYSAPLQDSAVGVSLTLLLFEPVRRN